MEMKKLPQRRCVGCKNSFDKKELIRVVKDSEGNISLDPTGKKNGRGAYLCKSKECFETAYKKKQLESSFKCKVSEEIYKNLLDELEKYHAE